MGGHHASLRGGIYCFSVVGVTYPEGQYNMAVAACHEGSAVETHYYPGLDHSGTVNPSLVDSLPFVRKALAGQALPGNCEVLKPPKLATVP